MKRRILNKFNVAKYFNPYTKYSSPADVYICICSVRATAAASDTHKHTTVRRTYSSKCNKSEEKQRVKSCWGILYVQCERDI